MFGETRRTPPSLILSEEIFKKTSHETMNPSNPKFSSIVPKCLKSEDPEAEIFLRNHDLVLAIENFMSQRTELWKVMLLENLAGEVIELIQNLVVSLEASENWKEATFWRSQIVRLHYQTDKLYRLWDDCPGQRWKKCGNLAT